MKFIFADCQDYVDPRYDFLQDKYGENRQIYWDDEYPHEILKHAPYDGILVSRAIVGGANGMSGKYSDAQTMRFNRVGAREFLRFNKPEHLKMPVFGDCGSFSYANLSAPPYTAEDTAEFYADGRFTHGCSIDHIIFDFDANSKGLTGSSLENRERYDITLTLAEQFLQESKLIGKHFTPIGVVQGWSPDSMAESAKSLAKMGFRYIAIGGLVPLKTQEIHTAVSAVHDAVSRWPSVKLHLLGFAKADNLREFLQYPKIASFDSTSPLIKAFKDSTKNYFLPTKNGELNYYSAIRIPQAIENRVLKNHAKTGLYKQEDLLKLEKEALGNLRAYAKGKATLNRTLDSLIEYSIPLQTTATTDEEALKRKLHALRLSYERTLEDRPWEKCKCKICRDVGVEVIIFRASNRNKRRGIHNLDVYHKHLNRITSL